jgi:hypothetical protein
LTLVLQLDNVDHWEVAMSRSNGVVTPRGIGQELERITAIRDWEDQWSARDRLVHAVLARIASDKGISHRYARQLARAALPAVAVKP